MAKKNDMKDKMKEIRKKNISPAQGLINMNTVMDESEEEEKEPEKIVEVEQNEPKIQEEPKPNQTKDNNSNDLKNETITEAPSKDTKSTLENVSVETEEPIDEGGKFSNLKNKLQKKRIEDTHVRRTFLIRQDLIDRLEKISNDARGFKQEFINTAIEMALNELEREMK